jgi:hypothetical protein
MGKTVRFLYVQQWKSLLGEVRDWIYVLHPTQFTTLSERFMRLFRQLCIVLWAIIMPPSRGLCLILTEDACDCKSWSAMPNKVGGQPKQRRQAS